ncbi:hypothetical protein [Dechloromonas denitrificans]|nr:hypothetical protein [Dechloromonas denitrificans]
MTIAPPLFSRLASFSEQAWLVGNRLAAYALLNLLDDPALLAFAFC